MPVDTSLAHSDIDDLAERIATSDLLIHNCGTLEFNLAWSLQKKLHASVVLGTHPGKLLLLEHPSVYTAGRMTQPDERPTDGTAVIDVDRGGKITWHGPGQIIGYPILKLVNRQNVVGFVRTLEDALMEVCSSFSLETTRFKDRSGVWMRDRSGDRKICAIGLRVAKGVSMHGFALNVNPDLGQFSRIVPCGFSDASVTSLTAELGRQIEPTEVLPILETSLQKALIGVAL
jgi:lipoyl(octanoyl) transferase